MLNLQKQQQQQLQVLNAALLGSLASDYTTIPVRPCPFEHCVRRFKEFFTFLVRSLSTFVFIWASKSFTSHSIISSLIAAACLHLYSVHSERCVRKLARWYWYVYTENHRKVHDCSNLLVGKASLPFSDVGANSLVEDEAHSGLKNNDRGDLVVEEEDARLILLDSETVGLVGGDQFQMTPKDDGEEAVGLVGGGQLQGDEAVGFVGGDQLQDDVAVGFVGGDQLQIPKDEVDVIGLVGEENVQIPGKKDENDSHGANEIVCHIGFEEAVGGDPEHVWKDISYVGGNASYSDKYSHAHSQIKNVDASVGGSEHPYVNVELDSGSSVPSFSNKKMSRGSSLSRRSRLRARALVRFGPGSCRCLRPRSLRFPGASVANVASSFFEVEMMEIDEEGKLDGSFEHAKEDVDSFALEPMDIDSLEEMSCVAPPFESLVATASFDVTTGGKTPSVVLEEGCLLQPLGNKCDVTQPVASSDAASRFVSFWENDDFPRVPLVVEEETRLEGNLSSVFSEPAVITECSTPTTAPVVVPALVVPFVAPAVVPEPVPAPAAPIVPTSAPVTAPTPIVVETTATITATRAAPAPQDEIDEFFMGAEAPSSSHEDVHLTQPSSSYKDTLKKLQALSAARIQQVKPAPAPAPAPRAPPRQFRSAGMGRRKKNKQ